MSPKLNDLIQSKFLEEEMDRYMDDPTAVGYENIISRYTQEYAKHINLKDLVCFVVKSLSGADFVAVASQKSLEVTVSLAKMEQVFGAKPFLSKYQTNLTALAFIFDVSKDAEFKVMEIPALLSFLSYALFYFADEDELVSKTVNLLEKYICSVNCKKAGKGVSSMDEYMRGIVGQFLEEKIFTISEVLGDIRRAKYVELGRAVLSRNIRSYDANGNERGQQDQYLIINGSEGSRYYILCDIMASGKFIHEVYNAMNDSKTIEVFVHISGARFDMSKKLRKIPPTLKVLKIPSMYGINQKVLAELKQRVDFSVQH